MLISLHKIIAKETVLETEEEYFLKLAKQEAKHFCYFYDKYYKAIYSFICRRTQDLETTRDITSQTFFKALQSINKYTYTGIPFSAFLFRIATNEITDYFRNNNKTRIVNIENLDDVDELVDYSTKEEQETKIKIIENALKELSEEELMLIEMRFFEKLSFKEIAEIKNWDDHNTKKRVYRIIEKLKKIIANHLKQKEAI